MKRLLTFLACLSVGASALSLAADEANPFPPPVPKRASPHEHLNIRIGPNRRQTDLITLSYGRPYTNDPKTGEPRDIWGGLVPFDKIWRTGADEATLFSTQKPLQIGSGEGAVTLPPGMYSLYTLPASVDSVTLVINKQLGQWGLEYHQDMDVARVPMQATTLAAPLHQFTMAVIKGGAPFTGTLCLGWENREYSVPFTIVH